MADRLVSLDQREQRGEVEPPRCRQVRIEPPARVRELAIRTGRIAAETLVAGGGQMDERPRELAIVSIRGGVGRAPEMCDGLQVLPLAEV